MKNKKIILIVCRGNILRSPFAEAIVNKELQRRGLDKKFTVLSRGIQGTLVDPIPVKFPNITFYKDEYDFSKPSLQRFRVDITRHVSKPVDKKIAEKANIILAVDEKNKVALETLFPNPKNKIYKLSELIGMDKDFVDPKKVFGFQKHHKILSGIRKVIIKGFPKLLALANSSKKI